MRAGLILLQVCLVDDWGLWSMDPSVERVPDLRLWHGHLEPVLLAMKDYIIFKTNTSPWTCLAVKNVHLEEFFKRSGLLVVS